MEKCNNCCGIKQCPNPCDNKCGCGDSCCGGCGGGCNPCKPKCCGIAKPVIDVQHLPDDLLTLSFNFNGVGTTYNFREMIKEGETDTSLSVDTIKRVLKYMAERHIDTIHARELGAILHLADLGDVDGKDIDAYSMLFYKKDAIDECDTTSNRWVAWNALDNQAESMAHVMGFSSEGAPISLSSPPSSGQQYLLGWNGAGQVSWTQMKTAATKPLNAYRVYWDDDAKEFVKVKEEE